MHSTLSIFLIAMLFTLVSSCQDSGKPRSKRNSSGSSEEVGGSGNETNGAGNNATGLGNTTTTVTLEKGRAELRHIIDPFSGTYKTKVTIPKNFSGMLYLSGLNITSLSDRLIYARFNFGREMESVTIPATIGRAPGITPQTDIEVVKLDISSKEFNKVRLLYDLYDYNYYWSEGSESLEPVTDPRDAGIYCRGLQLQHDPTFSGTSINGKCDAAGEKCLYAYAKIADSGLYLNNLTTNPTEPQIGLNGTYASDSDADNLKKCLPDNYDEVNFEGVMGVSVAGLAYNMSLTLDGATYTYQGPYRPIGYSKASYDADSSSTAWQVENRALFSTVSAATKPTGLFQKSFDGNDDDPDQGYQSFLFPRVGKMDLVSQVEHYSSTTAFNTVRTRNELVSSGQTDYMDGCNIRATNFDSFTNEGISSCNVTGTIQLLTIDSNTLQETILTGTGTGTDSGTLIKLQLIRPSLTDYLGREVLYTSMKTCSSSTTCAFDECCFNSRCWSKNIVSQCLEEVPSIGNLDTGEACSSDYRCSSLCCNQSKGVCDIHVNTNDQKVLCSKSPGQTCVAKEWCRQENISTCYLVDTGLDLQGAPTCAVRCYNVPTFGDCRNGICSPPATPTVPTYDSTCKNAIDPLSLGL